MLVSKTSPSHARQRAETCARTTGEARLAAVLGHPSPLVVPAVLADTARHISGIRAVLEVLPAGRVQRGIERRRPFLIALGKAPHLVGGQVEIAEHSPERLAAVNGVEEPPPYFGRETRLCPASEPCLGGGGLGLSAYGAATAVIPTRHSAVGHLRATSATLRIGFIADLV
jgi:hypothetical protein